jgi:hypothetical protein
VLGRTPRWTRAALAAVLLAVVPLAVAGPADAATVDCTTRSTAKTFTKWGDNNNYFLVPDGTFEAGARSWTLAGAGTVQLNNPHKTIASAANIRSLRISPYGRGTMPSMCVASDEDSLRFHYRAPGIPYSTLRVQIRVTSGVNVATSETTLDGWSYGWQVSPRIMLPDIRDVDGRQTIEVTFSATGVAATWYLDDVQIDPWRSL